MNDGDNQCGDVLLSSSVETATLWVPLLIDSEILCVDDTHDGKLDLSLCLTWRTDETDVACGVQGASSGLFPSSATGCHCETYEVPTITVLTVKDLPAPCK